MRALSVTNSSVTQNSLLKMAEALPGAWIGIRIAAMLLVLKGWNCTQVADLFQLSRWTVVKWIQRLNKEGMPGLEERSRPGRPRGGRDDRDQGPVRA